MKEKESDLQSLKESYSVLEKKYKLPSFSELNEDFDIEKLQERETELLLKSVRRVIVEKMANVVRFLELLLNPSEGPTPLFMYAILKNINQDVRKEIEDLYKDLSKVELNSLSLDIIYSEKEEAQFLCEAFKKWSKSKLKLKEITNKLGFSWAKEKQADRNYLG